jgi:Fe-Mn family superoxide dismutase
MSKITLKPLPFAYDALEPFMDKQTVMIHHGKHHQAYVDKLNAAIGEHTSLRSKSAEALIKGLDSVPLEIRTQVVNFGGGVYNHDFFWSILGIGNESPKGKMLEAIKKDFGSFDKFKEDFSKNALALFGSGWTWLVIDNEKGGKLSIVNTPNQGSPISSGKTPILVIDVWEHAYYLKYQNRRPEFIEAFFNIINWDKVDELYSSAKK